MAENGFELADVIKNKLPQKSFKYKKKENGQFLKIHNTIKTETGEKKRLRFCFIAFNCRNDELVGVDSRGNIFIFNLNMEKFSILNEKILECTILKYLPSKETQIIFGTKNGQLKIFDTYTGANLLILQPFKDSRIQNISFSDEINSHSIILISTKSDAIIYDLNTFEIKHKFELEYKMNELPPPPPPPLTIINKISFIPKSNKLFCYFNDDNSKIHLWDNWDFKELKKINPLELRDKYLMNSNAVVQLNLDDYLKCNGDGGRGGSGTGTSCTTRINPQLDKQNQNEQIVDICFSSTGKFICLSTIDNYLILLSINWEIIKLIHFVGNGNGNGNSSTSSTGIKQCEFLSPKINDLDKRIMTVIITTNDDLILLDWTHLNVNNNNNNNNNNPIAMIHSGNCFKFILTKNSQNILGLILCTGEIILYDLNVLIKRVNKGHTENGIADAVPPSSTSPSTIKQKQNKKKSSFINVPDEGNNNNNKVNDHCIHKILPRDRLIGILTEYNEYPMKYRTMIWKAILELPQNSSAFCELLHRDLHPCTADFDDRYPIVDISALRNLKRICSCLAHWNPSIFGKCKFLPNFIFPFVKLFEMNLISCFETIATLLINHCQLWFEFGPFTVPINYLGMIENCLAAIEPELIEFYCQHNITNETYAWSILKTAYTEILNDKQWYQLWDNIISSRDITFLLFTVIAYNSIQKSKILQLNNGRAIMEFFQMEQSINMKKFIEKSYTLMDDSTGQYWTDQNGLNHHHPKLYFKPFKHLSLGDYQPFINYPKRLIASVDREMNALQMENKILNKKLYELEKLEMKFSNEWATEEEQLRTDEHAKRIRDVEQQYLEAITAEEQRVAIQRKQLLVVKRQLREQERGQLMDVRKNLLKKTIGERERELEDLLKRFDNDRIREDSNLLLAEEDLKIREMKLLIEKYKTDMKLYSSSSTTTTTSSPPLSSSSLNTNNCQSLSERFNGEIKKLNQSKSKLNLELDKIKQTTKQRNNDCDSLQTSFQLSNNVSLLMPNMNGITLKINYINDMLKQMQLEFQRLIEKSNCTLDKNRKIKELQWQISQLENEVKKMLEIASNI